MPACPRSFRRVRVAALAPLLVLACTDRASSDDTTGSGSSSSAPESTGVSPTTSTSSSAGSATSSTGSATSSAGGTSESTGGLTGSGTTAETTEASTAALTGTDSGDSTGSGASTTGGEAGLVLDPSTLVFFELPINSIRYAVGGYDPGHDTCVSIIFNNPGLEQHCDDFVVDFPYVVITPGGAPPCMDWDYSGDVVVDAAAGCMQVTSQGPLAIDIDMTLKVSGDGFSGTIAVSNK